MISWVIVTGSKGRAWTLAHAMSEVSEPVRTFTTAMGCVAGTARDFSAYVSSAQATRALLQSLSGLSDLLRGLLRRYVNCCKLYVG